MIICLVLIFACGGGKPIAAKYHSDWSGENRTVHYKKAVNKVTGSGEVIDEEAKTLIISLFGKLTKNQTKKAN